MNYVVVGSVLGLILGAAATFIIADLFGIYLEGHEFINWGIIVGVFGGLIGLLIERKKRA
jgi:hypothetical protein